MSSQEKRQEAYLAKVEALMRAAATSRHIDVNDFGDCLQDYEKKRIKQVTNPPEDWESAEGTARLAKDVNWHVRMWLRNRGRARHPDSSLEQLSRDVDSGLTIEPASPEKGPEEALLALESAREIAALEDCLTEDVRRLWHRHVTDGERIVDLQEEFGKTANALRIMLTRARRKLRTGAPTNESVLNQVHIAFNHPALY